MKILVFSRLIFYSHSCYPIVIFKLMKVWLILFKGFLIMNRYNVIVDLCYLMADNSDLIFPCDILIVIVYHSFLSKIYAKIIIEKLFKRHMALGRHAWSLQMLAVIWDMKKCSKQATQQGNWAYFCFLDI